MHPPDDDDALREPLPAAADPAPVPPPVAPTQPPRRPRGDLPDLATRIEDAQRQARERRIEQGLPPDPDDGAYALKKPRKHAPKRQKRHGQFLGTACDSWEATRRR